MSKTVAMPTDTPKANDTEVRNKLTKARVKMLLKHPFWGNLATRLKLQDGSSWLATAATDGRYFYYNRDFIDALDDEEVVFLFGHEVGHLVYDHMGRRGERDAGVWNMAGDYVINDMLIENNVGKRITKVEILHDNKYRGMIADEVYDDLMANAVEVKMTLDMHLDGEEGGGEGAGSDGKSKTGNVVLDEETKKQIRDEIKEAVLQSAQAAGAGNVPAGIRRLIQEFTAPKMNWLDIVQIQFESSLKNNYSFMRPSRKGWHSGTILPGMVPAENLDVVIGIDMSGSISNEQAQDMLGEVVGLMDLYPSFNIHVFCFDTNVYNPQTFTEDNGSDIRSYETMGGGGTDFDCCWEYMKREGIEPKQFIMFTDGYPWGSWGDPNYCDTVFVIHGNESITAPFGVTTHYKFSNKKKHLKYAA